MKPLYRFLSLIGTIIMLLIIICCNNHVIAHTIERSPNVIVILVDDLGWTDLSVQGSTYYETPHIDRLSSEGMRFTNAYAAAAICSPTRAAILTGQNPARIGITDWIRSRFQGGEIPADNQNPTKYVGEPDKKLLTPPNPLWMELKEVTIAEILNKAGYTTAFIGKWHLGTEDWYPTKQGFDINVGGTDYGQPPSYFDPYCKEGQGCISTLEPRKEGEYLTDREADEAIQFISKNSDQPFFLYLAHYAVHTPIQAKEKVKERYKTKPVTNQDDPTYASMVHSVDQATGKILKTLEKLQIDDNTLIIFTSDNGGLKGPTDNSPLRSGKGYPYEGGIRVPMIIKGPGIEPASVSYKPVSSIDIMPTILAMTDTKAPENMTIDGISLKKHLLTGGKDNLNRDSSMIWHFPHYRQGHTIPPYSIIRSASWKLIKWWEGPSYELYNLQKDIGEQNNLAQLKPGKVEELNKKMTNKLEKMGARFPRPNSAYESSK